ncbi:uncharacterized protein LACBIDRAFT_306075 [Laccaria bicolor S238N-H82]|uniref:Predicted protein n=1 Tax=Laccaria bicolor (strain S238N-H82 / ATCC MYA-4686) TaxID=486041 RepID=B0CSN6_LACBS|nr:uncharacterized protein LACBIDRAFT_306075 [Laccaria bicolor S238N-H82]EDR14873.1 predicted protein [Laccaria bicolor S238N-H82]|eukprot:XP_001875432.1 predicted protein [Laccaria bicolor S238N-H82]
MTLRQEQPHSPTSYPQFAPHITLGSFSHLRLSEIRASIPVSQPPLQIRFDDIQVGSHYFRSVYISIKLTPELIVLHDEVHSSLGVEPRTPAYPHLSLCYIDDKDAEEGEREKFARDTHDSGYIRYEPSDGSLSICSSSSSEEDWITEFTSSEIWIAQCDGPVAEWSVIEKIPLLT